MPAKRYNCFLRVVLSWADYSYVVGGLGAKFLLGERLSPARWAGIVLVSVGVAHVCAG